MVIEETKSEGHDSSTLEEQAQGAGTDKRLSQPTKLKIAGFHKLVNSEYLEYSP